MRKPFRSQRLLYRFVQQNSHVFLELNFLRLMSASIKDEGWKPFILSLAFRPNRFRGFGSFTLICEAAFVDVGGYCHAAEQLVSMQAVFIARAGKEVL